MTLLFSGIAGPRWRATCLIAALFAPLAFGSCAGKEGKSGEGELAALARAIHAAAVASPASGKDDKAVDRLLKGLRIDELALDDLAVLRETYWSMYVEPGLDDSVMDGLDRIVKARIGNAASLFVGGQETAPTDVYVLSGWDPHGFQGQLESGYADDSLHIPEFPEAYPSGFAIFGRGDAIHMNIDHHYRLVVGPHRYLGHSWSAIPLDANRKGSFNLGSDVYEAVVFAIIAEKGKPRRYYKAIWVLEASN